MKTPPNKTVLSAGKNKQGRAVRPTIKIVVGIVCLACLGAVVVHFNRSRATQRANIGQHEVARTAQAVQPQRRSGSSSRSGFTGQARNEGEVFHIEPTPAARKLVGSLLLSDLPDGPLTEEQAAAWKENFRRLVQQGDISIPAIREFMEKNADVVFGPDAGQMLGYASVRMAMIDALMQIGSPLAETALDDLLKNTADPQEIAQLAKNLEKLAPGAYQSDMLDAARQTLAQNASGNLPGSDVAPLFQVLQHYGGADVVADLEGSATQWNHYAMIALAQLPDGAGVPALIQIATGQEGSSSGTRLAALQTLASMTPNSADARASLLDLARQGSLSPYEWAALVPFLGGNQTVYQDSTFGNSVAGINPTQLHATYISSSGQSIWTVPLAMTPQQIPEQEKFIDNLAAAAKGPAGVQASFNQSKNSLATRLVSLANSP
jgi:hypothetical protein